MESRKIKHITINAIDGEFRETLFSHSYDLWVGDCFSDKLMYFLDTLSLYVEGEPTPHLYSQIYESIKEYYKINKHHVIEGYELMDVENGDKLIGIVFDSPFGEQEIVCLEAFEEMVEEPDYEWDLNSSMKSFALRNDIRLV